MAHVQKLMDSKGARIYKVRWSERRAGTTKFHSKSFRRLVDAERFSAERDSLPGSWGRGRATFNTVAEAWLDSVRLSGKRSRTQEGYRHAARLALKFFDGVPLVDIDPDRAQDYLKWLLEGNEHTKGLKSPRSIHGAWHPFRATMGFAVQQGYIAQNPALGVKLPSLRKTASARERDYAALTPEQVELLADALVSAGREPYDLLVLFAAYTGLRRGEIAGLNVGDVAGSVVSVHKTRRRAPKGTPDDHPDRDPRHDGWLIEPTKSGKDRDVPMPAWLARDMADYLAAHPHHNDPDAPLWPRLRSTRNPGKGTTGWTQSLDYGEPWDPESFYRYVYRRAVAAAGLPPSVHFHTLRHSYVTWLIRDGKPPSVVAELAGHADATITLQIYTHLFKEDRSDAVAGLTRPRRRPTATGTSNVIPMHA